MNPASMTLTEVGAGLLAVAAAIGAWMKVIRPGIRIVKLVVDFLDDWNGEPEQRDSSGQIVEKARPGWRGRLAAMEHELHPNSGSSIKDAVDRTEAAVGALDGKVAKLAEVDAADREASTEAHRRIHARIDQLYADKP